MSTLSRISLLAILALSRGAAIGFHTHPGDEIGFVERGTLILKARGQPLATPVP
jgi:quercetin dioxygenase-like cupin family protein